MGIFCTDDYFSLKYVHYTICQNIWFKETGKTMMWKKQQLRNIKETPKDE